MIHSPPHQRQENQEALVGQPRSRRWARITNPALNQSPVIRRKDADRLVRLGRAEWLAADQLRLNNHATNVSNREAAAAGYEWPAAKVFTLAELRNIGIENPAKALRENITIRTRGRA